MPKTYRVMQREDGRPALGESATALGARVPRDIRPDDEGRVHPGKGGISVAPSIRALYAPLVPKRLRQRVPGARGNDSHCVWSMGQGPFEPGAVAAGLCLRVDTDNQSHGLVEPDAIMALAEYRAALSATQDAWSVDEE